MPNLDPRFVQIPPLQDFFIDKNTGTPLSAGIVTFYKDNDHTVLKPVYQLTVTPSNAYEYKELANPLQLSSVGTFIDENGNDIVPYFFPYDGTPTLTNDIIELYYITVTDSAGGPQFTREAWPNITSMMVINGNPAISENQISNPQFSKVNFPGAPASSYTFSVTGTNIVTNIAPNWDIVTSGTGTVTIQQIASTNVDIPSNTPFLLDINSTSMSLTMLQLRQRLYQDPRLFVGAFVNGYFVAEAVDGLTHQLIMSYVPSNVGATSYQIINTTTPAAGFNSYTGTVPINGTVINPDSPLTGYVDIIISIPPTAHIQLSSIQLVAVPTENSTSNFIEQTTQRELDHLFHYYQNELLIKPKDTILTGWDFALNPWQFTPRSSTIITNKCQYIADQTILYSQSASALMAGQANIMYNNTLSITANSAGSASNQFAIIQYVDPTIARPYWGYIASALMRARIFTTNNTEVGVKMRLIYSTNLPTTIGVSEPIVSLSGDTITFSAPWNALAPLNDPTYILPNSNSMYETSGSNAFPHFSFDSFQLPTCAAATQTLGIVIYTTSALNNSVGSPDSICFGSCSLTPNRFAVQTNPKSTSQTLSECEFYFEKSFNTDVLPNTLSPSAFGQEVTEQNYFIAPGGGNMSLFTSTINIDLRTVKRANPGSGNIFFYSPNTNILGNITGLLFLNGSVLTQGDISISNYSFGTLSTKYITLLSNNATQLLTTIIGVTQNNPFAAVAYQYIVDTRLGI